MNQSTEQLNTPLIARYYEIMKNYRNGVYGNNHLTLSEILEKAGEPNLINEMSLEEIDYLLKISTGTTRMLFTYAKKTKENLTLNGNSQHLRKRTKSKLCSL